jgi:hypothetical protein
MNSDPGRLPLLDAAAAQRLLRMYTDSIRRLNASGTADGH